MSNFNVQLRLRQAVLSWISLLSSIKRMQKLRQSASPLQSGKFTVCNMNTADETFLNNDNTPDPFKRRNDDNTKAIFEALKVPALSSAASFLLDLQKKMSPSQLNTDVTTKNQYDPFQVASIGNTTEPMKDTGGASSTAFHLETGTTGPSVLDESIIFSDRLGFSPNKTQNSLSLSKTGLPHRVQTSFPNDDAPKAEKRARINNDESRQQTKDTEITATVQTPTKQNIAKVSVFGGKRNYNEAFSTSCTQTNTSKASPFEHLNTILSSRGYSIRTYSSTETGYQVQPTPLQIASFGTKLLGAIQSSDELLVSKLLMCGLSRNPCNKFGDNILNLVCKRGNHDMLRCFLEHGSSVQVADGFGRTPLHHSAWAAKPCFKSVSMILDRSLELLRVKDGNGKTPLEYVTRDNWTSWIEFLDQKKDVYWPERHGAAIESDDELFSSSRARLLLKEPGQTMSVELATKVAAGVIDVEDIYR